MLPASLASIHYWRAARADWPRLLDRIVELGFPAIDTYVPWAIHMPRPGAGEWLDEVAPRISPFLRQNGGPVVALQVDNEMSYFFRPGPFEMDYHPGAI